MLANSLQDGFYKHYRNLQKPGRSKRVSFFFFAFLETYASSRGFSPPRVTVQSLSYLKKSHEFPLRAFQDVPWINQKKSVDTVQEALVSVLTAPWNFGDNIDAERDVDGYMDVGDFLFHEEAAEL